jgi:hypothetical protein
LALDSPYVSFVLRATSDFSVTRLQLAAATTSLLRYTSIDRQQHDNSMCSDLGSGSRCCAMYSATGIIFTVSGTLHIMGIALVGEQQRGFFLGSCLAKVSSRSYFDDTMSGGAAESDSQSDGRANDGSFRIPCKFSRDSQSVAFSFSCTLEFY